MTDDGYDGCLRKYLPAYMRMYTRIYNNLRTRKLSYFTCHTRHPVILSKTA